MGGRQVDVPDVRGLSQKDAAAEALEQVRAQVGGPGPGVQPRLPRQHGGDAGPACRQDGQAGPEGLPDAEPRARSSARCRSAGQVAASGRALHRAGGLHGGHDRPRPPAPDTYADEVLATDPPPGGGAVSGSVVNILVSKGPPRDHATSCRISRASPTSRRESRWSGSGMVVRESGDESGLLDCPGRRSLMQEPPPGFIVARGDTITLTVSSDRRRGDSSYDRTLRPASG